MRNLCKIASRNLLRYKRRTLLTTSLIGIGVVFVLVFVAVTGSFKRYMVGQITDSYLGDVQVHRRGYVASIENLPLTMNLKAGEAEKIRSALAGIPEVEAVSERIKFGGMFSNFTETTNIRMNGVVPEKEFATCPLMGARVLEGAKDISSLQRGKILIPELLARGMKVKLGDTVVIVATNRQGSVNGKTFAVGGILESATGPGGRDGYMHMDDAVDLLRLKEREVTEVVVNLKNGNNLKQVSRRLQEAFAGELNPMGMPKFEVHTWDQLSPFANIANMIDVMTFFIKLMLVAVVLVSILNVMIMAVYERVREIGTIAAIGTLPRRILSLFLVEGFFLGVTGAVLGGAAGGAIILVLNFTKISFSFGRNPVVLSPAVAAWDVATVALAVIIVSVLASLQPAYKAARMEPIDALRHV